MKQKMGETKNGDAYRRRLGLRVKIVREKLGMPQEELAEALGYRSTKSVISQIEAGGKGMSRHRLVKLSRISGVPGQTLESELISMKKT